MDMEYQELLVNFERNLSIVGDYFLLPQGIVSQYRLKEGDALLCELVNLIERRAKTKKIKEINKEVMVDIITERKVEGKLFYGRISCAVRDIYGIEGDSYDYDRERYGYALFKIKKVIRKDDGE